MAEPKVMAMVALVVQAVPVQAPAQEMQSNRLLADRHDHVAFHTNHDCHTQQRMVSLEL